MSSIYLRPPESGDEFGMRGGFIHKISLFQTLSFTVFAPTDFTALVLLFASDR